MPKRKKKKTTWRDRLNELVFHQNTFGGQLFDLTIMTLIFISVFQVVVGSIPGVTEFYTELFDQLEWLITVVFSIEYVLRIIAAKRPIRYATSFLGIVDLLSVIPTYLGLFVFGAHSFVVVRILKLFRVFRILKLFEHVDEAQYLALALQASRKKISIFITVVIILTVVIGALMYLVEGGSTRGFESIPKGIYWTIVTMSTVGYGDIVPMTSVGQLFASIVMLVGYGIIAVPTGIVTAEFTEARRLEGSKKVKRQCPRCSTNKHQKRARYCRNCGERLRASL